MKRVVVLLVSAGSFLMIAPDFGHSAPSSDQICKKMIADGRGGGMSQNDCLCIYRVADASLDDDIKALIFDSWYTGNNNLQALEQLPKPGRIEKQLKTMQRSLKTNCG